MLTSEVHKIIYINYPKMLCVFNNGKNRWANDINASNEISKMVIKKLEQFPEYIEEVYGKYLYYAQELSLVIEKILSFTSKTPMEDLIRWYHQYNKIYINVYMYGWLPLATEGLEGNFSMRLTNILKNCEYEGLSQGELFNTLMSPRTFTIRQEEELSLLEIMSFIKNEDELDSSFRSKTHLVINSNISLKILLEKTS